MGEEKRRKKWFICLYEGGRRFFWNVGTIL